MSETRLLEIDDETAGLLVKDHGGYRFYSSGPGFDRFDGHVFQHPREATNTLRAHLRRFRTATRRAA